MIAASCSVAVIWPVLWATGVPGGRPAGIWALNACARSTDRRNSVAAGDAASRRSMALRMAARSSAVVTLLRPARKAGAVLHAAQDKGALGAEGAHGGRDARGVEQGDERVGSQVARMIDHALGEPPDGDPIAHARIHGVVGIVGRVERVRRSVHDRVERIHQQHRLIQRNASGVRLAQQVDQHRHLHGAGGVVDAITVQRQLAADAQVHDRDGHFGAGNGGDAGFEAGAHDVRVEDGALGREGRRDQNGRQQREAYRDVIHGDNAAVRREPRQAAGRARGKAAGE
jgi:hypothetical protein